MQRYRSIVPFCCVTILFALVSPQADGQTTANPDFSVISRFRVTTNDAASLPASRSFASPEFQLDELEFAIQGYLNPYARADIYLAKPGMGDEPFEIEEATATILRGLPMDINLRFGKYLLEFGKNNTQHPHAWPFVSRPLSVERFLGEEGAGGVGMSASVLVPTGDIYTRWNVDVFGGGSFLTLDPITPVAGGVGMSDTLGGRTRLGAASRITSFFPVGEWSDLEVGVSGLTGIHDPYAVRRFWYGNVEFKYKWKPDAYTSWTIQGEAIVNRRSVASGAGATAITTSGWYVMADRQFQKVFSLGGRFDGSESPYAATDRAWGGALWFGFYPVEETLAFRLEWQHVITESPVAPRTGVNVVSLQMTFSLGPHRAHPF